MTEQRWTAYDTKVTYLSSELTDVVDGANKLGAVIDFTAVDRVLYMDVEFILPSTDLSGSPNPAINLWMLGTLDGTTYEDGTDSIDPAKAPDMIMPLRKVNGAQRVIARFLRTTPDKGKILFENRTGATILTGASLSYRTYTEQSV